MEIIKRYRYIFLPLLVSAIFFFIPIFWFKPNEVDLGGDSSRLYFYDPLTYLHNSALYVISASSFGVENLNYVNLPFISLLLILKNILHSPTLLISVFHGLSLSLGYYFCYLVILELIGKVQEQSNEYKAFFASSLGALLYVLSPVTNDGWAHVLQIHNQFFLNPIMFYLLLKFLKHSKILYLTIAILMTFVFSPNFSIAAAPPFFAFYPISVIFLLSYTRWILKKTIRFKYLLFGCVLFIGIQAFHLYPQFLNIMSPQSDIHATIFSMEGKYTRGLEYFLAIAPNIKVSLNILGFPQMKPLPGYSWIFIVFAIVMVWSLLKSKNKTLLLTFLSFIVIVFFASANITNVWLSLYKSLFSIPGFSMFRNFYGQWQYVYIFFYSILFGQALYVILHQVKKTIQKLIVLSISILLIMSANSFITGKNIRENLWQSNQVSSIFQMDQEYTKVLSFINSLPSDARVLTLPLTDPGYQIIAGKNGGAYMGPSTISYLAGKKDFAGYEEFKGFKDIIINLIVTKQFITLNRILGILNIRYILYNADPVVLRDFPSYPYQHVRRYLPTSSNEYFELINNLRLNEIKNINNKYYIYELSDDYFLPQLFIAKKSLFYNHSLNELEIPLSIQNTESRVALYNYGTFSIDPKIIFHENIINYREQSSLQNILLSTKRLQFGFPFVSQKMSSFIYPFILQREQKQLDSYRQLDLTHIDRSIFFAEKRIAELERWSKDIKVLENIESIEEFSKKWREPSIWESVLYNKYNYWEVGILRYRNSISKLIDKINQTYIKDPTFVVFKDRIKKSISDDRERLYSAIRYSEKISDPQKIYLLKLSISMFDELLQRLIFDAPSYTRLIYRIDDISGGMYDLMISHNILQDRDKSSIDVQLGDHAYTYNDFRLVDKWFIKEGIQIDAKNTKTLSLTLSNGNNTSPLTDWESVEETRFDSDKVELSLSDLTIDKRGILIHIPKWNHKSYYEISFDYVTHGKGFILSIFDKRNTTYDSVTNLLRDELRTKQWKSYRTFIASSDDTYSAYIQVSKTNVDGLFNQIESVEDTTKIEIRNLRVIRIPYPEIIFRNKQTIKSSDTEIPNITFTRINPTKYKIRVINVNYPYTLVLSEEFNEHWKVINPHKNTNTLKSYITRYIGRFMRVIISTISKPEFMTNVLPLTYFNDSVKEIPYKDSFLNADTFDSWGKDEVAQFKHYPVNGYANAWNIEPADVDFHKEYDLIVEMTTQKTLYVSLLISCVVALITAGFIVFHIKK